MSDFLSRNKPEWEELARLVARARKRTKSMSPEDLARLDVLYRRTTVHLAQVATRTDDASLLAYLNDLTAAAHSVIYLPPRGRVLAGATGFFIDGFSRAVVRTWRYHAAAAALVFAGALIAYFAASSDVLAAYALSMPGDMRMPGSTSEQLRKVLASGRDAGGAFKFFFASFLFSHNLRVGIFAMGLGVLAGVPTVFLMIYNGMILGAFAAMHHGAGIYAEFWAWILPHAVTELSAVILCGGVGLLLGRAVLNPGELTRTEALSRAGAEAARICMGVAVMLVLAALIESYLRQSELSTAERLIFAAASALFWVSYLAFGSLRERAARQAAQATAATARINSIGAARRTD